MPCHTILPVKRLVASAIGKHTDEKGKEICYFDTYAPKTIFIFQFQRFFSFSKSRPSWSAHRGAPTHRGVPISRVFSGDSGLLEVSKVELRSSQTLLRKCTEVRQCALAFSFFCCSCRAFLQSVSAAVVQVILDSSPWCQSGASFGGRCRSLHALLCRLSLSHRILFLIPDGNVAKDEIVG